MHFQQGFQQGADEILLFNERGELTEASACNAYIVKNGEVITPVLDSQKLPGITRHILLELLRKDGSIAVQERPVLMEEVLNADEIPQKKWCLLLKSMASPSEAGKWAISGWLPSAFIRPVSLIINRVHQLACTFWWKHYVETSKSLY